MREPISITKLVGSSTEQLLEAVRAAGPAGASHAELVEVVARRDNQTEVVDATRRQFEIAVGVRHWLEYAVETGKLVELDYDRFGVNALGGLEAAAKASAAVAAALETLAEAWQEAAADGHPLLRESMHTDYPFAGTIRQAAENAGRWAAGLRQVASRMTNNPTIGAEAIRRHQQTLADRLKSDRDEWLTNGSAAADDLSEFWEQTIRSGLGGIYGDVAASASPAVWASLADLLGEIGKDDMDTDKVRTVAESLVGAYRSSRSRDDHR